MPNLPENSINDRMPTSIETLVSTQLRVYSLPDRSASVWSASNGTEIAILGGTKLGEFGAMTAKGRGRGYIPVNQDAFLVVEDPDQRTVLVSLDGIGSRNLGEDLGEVVPDIIIQSFAQDLVAGVPFCCALETARETLIGYNRVLPKEFIDRTDLVLGATFAACEIQGNLARFFSTNYSSSANNRAVVVRDGQVIFDTTLPNNYPDNFSKSLINCWLQDPPNFYRWSHLPWEFSSGLVLKNGEITELKTTHSQIALQLGDQVVLGSNGLWDVLSPDLVIKHLTGARSLRHALSELRTQAERMADCLGFEDNINFIIYSHRNGDQSSVRKPLS